MFEFAVLAGRRVLVTGASSGIGRAIALELARAGAHLIIHAARSKEAAEATATECRKFGRDASVELYAFGELSSPEEWSERVWEEQGPIDVWVNNAGADILTGTQARASYAEKLKLLLEVDVQACMLLNHLVGVKMKARGKGVILNIGWDQADRGMEGESGELFAATKNAVMGYSRSLALSLAPEVRVNCIAPGWIRTAWGDGASDAWQERVLRETPLQRWGTPEDIARLARFLVSDEASYITGQVICANGGAVR